MPTYSIVPDIVNVTEAGQIITFTIITTDVPNNTVLTWNVLGTNVDGNDFTPTVDTGTVTIVLGFGQFTLTTRADLAVEGYEFFIVQLIGDVQGPVDPGTGLATIIPGVVAVSPSVRISDTSRNFTDNGSLVSVTNDQSKLAYRSNNAWYKVTGTAIPL